MPAPKPARSAYGRLVARLPRTLLPDGVFHAIGCGVDGVAIARDDIDRIEFMRLLVAVIRRFRWTSHAYCLMTTHYHLVVGAARADLSSGMHRLNGRYARRFNARHGRAGHLFRDRFAAFVVDSDDYFAAVCDYVVENPVRAGLARSIGEWPWAGYGAPTAEL